MRVHYVELLRASVPAARKLVGCSLGLANLGISKRLDLCEANESVKAFADGLAGSLESGVGLAIKGFPAPEDAAEVAHGLAALRDGAAITLLEDASHVFFRLGTKKDREAVAEQAIVSAGVGDDAASWSENEAGILGENGAQSFALHPAVAGEAVKIENNGEREAGVTFDLPYRVR